MQFTQKMKLQSFDTENQTATVVAKDSNRVEPGFSITNLDDIDKLLVDYEPIWQDLDQWMDLVKSVAKSAVNARIPNITIRHKIFQHVPMSMRPSLQACANSVNDGGWDGLCAGIRDILTEQLKHATEQLWNAPINKREDCKKQILGMIICGRLKNYDAKAIVSHIISALPAESSPGDLAKLREQLKYVPCPPITKASALSQYMAVQLETWLENDNCVELTTGGTNESLNGAEKYPHPFHTVEVFALQMDFNDDTYAYIIVVDMLTSYTVMVPFDPEEELQEKNILSELKTSVFGKYGTPTVIKTSTEDSISSISWEESNGITLSLSYDTECTHRERIEEGMQTIWTKLNDATSPFCDCVDEDISTCLTQLVLNLQKIGPNKETPFELVHGVSGLKL